MRYKVAMFFCVISFLTIIILGYNVLPKNRIDMSFAEEGTMVFRYGDVDATSRISEQEMSWIKELFAGKILYKDNPSCGFTEDVSICFNGSQTFCFACDTCPIIYWKEKERYFKISGEEQEQLYELLKAYGFSFPCV